MANFKLAYDKTAVNEGGYANVAHDNGGETYCGIARNIFPNWIGWIDIDKLKSLPGFPENIDKLKLAPKVEQFFKFEFWDKMKLDLILDQDIAEELYDSGVNFGISRAVKFAQEACNLLNNSQKLYPDIDVDGDVGPKTLSTINNHPNRKILFNLMNILQGERYVELCRINPTQEKFLVGWLRMRVITKA